MPPSFHLCNKIKNFRWTDRHKIEQIPPNSSFLNRRYNKREGALTLTVIFCICSNYICSPATSTGIAKIFVKLRLKRSYIAVCTLQQSAVIPLACFTVRWNNSDRIWFGYCVRKCFLAYQTGLSAIFTSARKSHLTHPWGKMTLVL